MTSHLMRSGAVAALLATVVLAGADKSTKAAIAAKAKPATARIVGRPASSAFCVHASGLFITTDQVIRAVGDRMALVIGSSLKTETTYEARVLRLDRDLGLAVLSVEAKGEFPVLALGTGEDLTELAEVITMGYPFAPKESPSVHVNTATVKALHRKAGEAYRIDLAVALDSGHVGGPVLDEGGKVVGVISRGARSSQAIPVAHVQRLLATPLFTFTPTPLTPAAARKPADVSVRVVSVPPPARPFDVRLLLQAGDEEPREVTMERKGDAFGCRAVPLPAGPPRLELTVRFDGGAVTGPADDRVFKVGDQPVRLAELGKVTLRPKPSAVRADGKTTLEGAITGLDRVEVKLGGKLLTVALDRAKSIQVVPLPAPTTVNHTFVARQGEKEVGRTTVAVPVREPGWSPLAATAPVIIKPPEMSEDRVVKTLPEPYADVALGGGGRYLVFHLPKQRKLAVFDVSAAMITGYLPVAEDKITFGAGLHKLVVGLPRKGEVERWDLATLERELNVPWPLKGDVGPVIMGSASSVPVVSGTFLDLATLKPLPIKYPGASESAWGLGSRVLASADGSVYGTWNTNYSPGSCALFALEGRS